MLCPMTVASVKIPRTTSFLLSSKNKISNEYLFGDLLKVIAYCLPFYSLGVVEISAWDPGLLLGHCLDHTSFSILCKSKFDLLQVVFAAETAFIKGFIVVRGEFCGIGPLNRINKVSLTRVFVKSVSFGLI